MDEREFRKYVRQLLTEDDGGGGGDGGYGGFGGDWGMMGGMGGMYMMGSTQGLYDSFVKPFVEVIQTASGATKEVMRRVGTLTAVALEAVITTFVPVVRDSYDEIFENERRDIDALREKYKAVYASNMEMFSHADMNVLAFAIDPTKYLTGAFLRKAPKAAMKAMEIASGDSTSLKYWFKRVAMLYDFTGGDRDWQKQEWEYNMQRRRFDGTMKGGRRSEGTDKKLVLVEEASDTSWKKDALADLMAQMMNDPKVIDALENSQMFRSMHDDAIKIMNKFHASVKAQADEVNRITDFNSLKSYIKATKNSKAISALDNFEKAATQAPKPAAPEQKSKEEPKQEPVQNEVEGTEQQAAMPQNLVSKFTVQAKKAIKGIFGSGVVAQIQAAKTAGMSDDSEIVQILKRTKQDVENLRG
jgi:hypothetical protein